jgi:excisionase family DNA binding protein
MTAPTRTDDMAPDPGEPPLYASPARAAALLDVSRDTIDRAVQSGELKAVRLRGRVLISRASFDRLPLVKKTEI